MESFINFVLCFFVFLFFVSKFEVTPIKKKKCNSFMFEKNNTDRIPFQGLKEDIYHRSVILSNINSTKSTINFFGIVYDFILYDNSTHIYVNLCRDVDDMVNLISCNNEF